MSLKQEEKIQKAVNKFWEYKFHLIKQAADYHNVLSSILAHHVRRRG
jgi:hypothetical protein